MLELGAEEDVFTENSSAWDKRVELTPAAFRDPAAGWVVSSLGAPCVRILEVRDATPEEVAAADAREEEESSSEEEEANL